jgi:hypothetical protein
MRHDAVPDGDADLGRWSTTRNAMQRLDAVRTQATTAWLQPPSAAAAGAFVSRAAVGLTHTEYYVLQ